MFCWLKTLGKLNLPQPLSGPMGKEAKCFICNRGDVYFTHTVDSVREDLNMIVLKKTMFWKSVCDYTGKKKNIKNKGKKIISRPILSECKKEISGQ